MPKIKEVERRFVVEAIDPDFQRFPSQDIQQGYLRPPPRELRVRIIHDAKAVVTLKCGRGRERLEDEEEVNMSAAHLLMNACRSLIVRKTRYCKDGWEVDVFEPPLTGLIIAEFEGPEDEVNSLVLPPWIHKATEVTDSLSNYHLARLVQDLTYEPGVGGSVRAILPKSLPRIVLTGGPCSGKSTAIETLKKDFGYAVHFVPEVATMVISQVGLDPSKGDAATRRNFQRIIARVQRSFEEASELQALNDGKSALVLDRGVLDGAAYMEGGLNEFERVCGTATEYEYSQYDLVVFLGMPSREVFEKQKANNPARSETWAEAYRVSGKTLEAWLRHPNLQLVGETTTWQEKVGKVRHLIRKHLRI